MKIEPETYYYTTDGRLVYVSVVFSVPLGFVTRYGPGGPEIAAIGKLVCEDYIEIYWTSDGEAMIWGGRGLCASSYLNLTTQFDGDVRDIPVISKLINSQT